MLYLWLTPDLVDPRSAPRPLATWDGDKLEWYGGRAPDIKEDGSLAEILADLPVMLSLGVRYNQTGMGAGNIQEGRPFTPPCGACWRCVPDYALMRLCPTCDNKRCPKASDHDLACTNSNEPRQPGSIYAGWRT